MVSDVLPGVNAKEMSLEIRPALTDTARSILAAQLQHYHQEIGVST